LRTAAFGGDAWRISGRRHVLVALLVATWVVLLSVSARAGSVSGLVSKLKNHPNYKVRLTAALVLGKKCDPRAFDALVFALKSDANPLVRGAAANSLARMGLPQAAGALKAALRTHNSLVKSQVKRALGRLCPSKLSGITRYVNLDRMIYHGPAAGKIAVALARCRLAGALTRSGDVTVRWRRCKRPSRRELARRHIKGYYLDVVVKIREKHGMVSCKLTPTFFSYPRAKLLTTGGGARVKVSGSLNADTIGTCLDYAVKAIKSDVVQTLHRL